MSRYETIPEKTTKIDPKDVDEVRKMIVELLVHSGNDYGEVLDFCARQIARLLMCAEQRCRKGRPEGEACPSCGAKQGCEGPLVALPGGGS